MSIADTCFWALDQHIQHYWRWPRESDLVADLVANIKSRFAPYSNTFQIAKSNGSDRASTKEIHEPTLIVRTEVKISNYKIDICILNECPTYHYGQFGERDILLSIPDPQKDIKEILEVKLDPHTLKYWVKDIRKLADLYNSGIKCPMHLLSLDNSFMLNHPLPSRKNSGWWPLMHGKKIIITHNGIRKLQLDPITFSQGNKLDPGIYLWTLGVTSTHPKLQAQPSCWKLVMPIFSKQRGATANDQRSETGETDEITTINLPSW